MSRGDVLWAPDPASIPETQLGRFAAKVRDDYGVGGSYDDLWRWSVDHPGAFWSALWGFFGLGPDVSPEAALAVRRMPGALWFPDVRLNFSQRALLGAAPSSQALVSESQTRPSAALSWEGLRDQVSRARAGLVRLGVGPGDRVAAYLPNIGEAVVAFLATASLGAVWTSCAPEFRAPGAVSRFQQVDPKVLLVVDGYRYGGRLVDRRDDVRTIRSALPSLVATVAVPYPEPPVNVEGTMSWEALLDESAPLEFEQVPFDHPLYILYSSGTTGSPKPIVHGHGGMVLEHLKAHCLHGDLGPGDRFFWFTTTGWMMWNFLVSGLLSSATIICFDGDPGSPDLSSLWRLAERQKVTHFGVSAPFLHACTQARLRPGDDLDLSSLRWIGSTGAPLSPDGFEWVYDSVAADVSMASISGGTDVCTAFVGGSPMHPVRSGTIACRYLGAKVEAWSPAGTSLVGQEGELVLTEPMPSMPVGFWGDDDGSRYAAAYFERVPNVWCHGDWITIAPDGSCVISGRSDATLNRAGVRIGTAEFYEVVDGLPQIDDSLVVHLEDPSGGPGQLLLFVVLTTGEDLTLALRTRISDALRAQLSPRHVPDEIRVVPVVPRTLSGKRMEIPVKRVLQGQPVDLVALRGSLADADALDHFVGLSARWR